jgi:O-antigen/teichoic acid export membrane protein
MNSSGVSLQRAGRFGVHLSALAAGHRVAGAAFSFADQLFSVGGVFVANVVLARAQSKEEYGVFALSYSVFTFLSSIHNAAILEPYSVYGAGRYRDRFPEYFRLIARSNIFLGLALTAILLVFVLLLHWMSPGIFSRALLGLAISVAVLLSGTFVRRVFYIRRQPALAATTSLLFFMTVACGLGLARTINVLNSLSVYLILALGWLVAVAAVVSKLPVGDRQRDFLKLEPDYWRQHWKYTRWVLATALVFQLGTQGYYWVVAGFLSVREVAELKAMYVLVAPVDQVLIVFSYLALPALASHYASGKMSAFLSLWKLYAAATVLVTGVFALLIRMVAQPVLHIVYAGKFDGLVPLICVLALLPLLLGIGHTMSNALNAIEKPKLVFQAYLWSGVVTFVLGIPLVMHFGLRGAVYGILCSGAAYTLTLIMGFVANIHRHARPAPAIAQ